MNTADYAFITSILSIIISIGALIWNVWQKFIFVKPRLQVTFAIVRIMQPDRDRDIYTRTDQQLLNLRVSNLGPGAATIYACITKSKDHWWSKAQYNMINPIHGDPTAPNPKSLGRLAPGYLQELTKPISRVFTFHMTRIVS
jgi:hypothetical protein